MKIKTYTVPPEQKANVIQRCDGLDFYIPQGKSGGAQGPPGPQGPQGIAGQQGPQGEPGTNCTCAAINYFDGWMDTLTPVAQNLSILFQTTLTHTLNAGISYDKKTGIVKVSTGTWFVQYGFTVMSPVNVTLRTYVTQNGVEVPVSTLLQPLIANQTQTISRTFVMSASTDHKLTLVCANSGVTLTQINWYVRLLNE